VIVLDAEKYEIRDTWVIGDGGTYVKTAAFARTSSAFYAATDQGLKRTAVNTVNPADFRSWQTLSGTAGLAPAAAKAVVSFNNKAIVLQNDSLFIENGNAWHFLFANGSPIVSLQVSAQPVNGVAGCCNRSGTGGGAERCRAVQRIIQNSNALPAPQKSVAIGNRLLDCRCLGKPGTGERK
jgi:hypothetical protein